MALSASEVKVFDGDPSLPGSNEILSGTNSTDRTIAVRAVIQRLLALPASLRGQTVAAARMDEGALQIRFKAPAEMARRGHRVVVVAPSDSRELVKEGKLGFWRWTSIVFGVAGTYRQNDSVDVVYERAGQRVVATGLPLTQDS